MLSYFRDLFNLSKGIRRFVASESMLGISIGLFVLVYNLHLLQLGFSPNDIGKITSIGTLIMGVLSVPISLLANHLGRKKLLVTGLVFMAIGYFVVAIGESYSIIFLAQIFISIGITLLITNEIQLLFYYSRSKKEETKAFSMLFAVFTLFTGVGTLLGGFIPKWLGGHTTVYQSSLIVAAAFMLLVAIVRGIFLPKEEGPTPNQVNPFAMKRLKEQLSSRSIWILSLFTLLLGGTYAIVIPFLNIIVKYRLDWSDELVSMLLTINGLFLFIGSILTPYILERLSINKAYLVAYSINILVSVLLFFTVPVWFFAFLLLFRGGSFTLLSNMVDSQSMQAVEEEERNLFAGIRTVLRSFGAAIFNFIAGIILNFENYYLPFLIAAILLIVGSIYFLVWVSPIIANKVNNRDFHGS